MSGQQENRRQDHASRRPKSAQAARRLRLPLTPMIDVTFLLLVFFRVQVCARADVRWKYAVEAHNQAVRAGAREVSFARID